MVQYKQAKVMGGEEKTHSCKVNFLLTFMQQQLLQTKVTALTFTTPHILSNTHACTHTTTTRIFTCSS